MAEIIGVRFKSVGKVYYFDPGGLELQKGDRVIVETARGMECGEVAMTNRVVEDEEIIKPLKRVVRAATLDDERRVRDNTEKEKQAVAVCNEKIARHKLTMKLVEVEYAFDGSKILFYFTADGRIDFRELVKDLAGVFRTRIELRQIGVRDEAKMLGGIGICGRAFCCSTFLGDFQPVSIKMAKEQGLSLNPTKISGTCGRLMCCLKYEQEAYEDLLRNTPRAGAWVRTPEGRGTVNEVSLLTGYLKIATEKDGVYTVKSYHKDEIQWDRPQGAERAPESSEGGERVERAPRGNRPPPRTDRPQPPRTDRPQPPRPEKQEREAAPAPLLLEEVLGEDAAGDQQARPAARRRRRGGRGGKGGKKPGGEGQAEQSSEDSGGES